jgi:hypothetical protein
MWRVAALVARSDRVRQGLPERIEERDAAVVEVASVSRRERQPLDLRGGQGATARRP